MACARALMITYTEWLVWTPPPPTHVQEHAKLAPPRLRFICTSLSPNYFFTRIPIFGSSVHWSPHYHFHVGLLLGIAMHGDPHSVIGCTVFAPPVPPFCPTLSAWFLIIMVEVPDSLDYKHSQSGMFESERSTHPAKLPSMEHYCGGCGE